jgi:hypothetical protein
VTWAPDYVTTAELKSYQRISDTDDDTLLALWITAASRAVDKHCGRQFGQVATVEAREYTTVYDRHQGCYLAVIDDLPTITGLIVLDADAVEITDYTLDPVNALLKGKPYERLWLTSSSGTAALGWPYSWPWPLLPTGRPLTITAKWGWTAVPSAVKVATMLQASRFAARRDSPYGIAGSPSEGSELRLLATLDPDLKTSLSAFRRDWWAG